MHMQSKVHQNPSAQLESVSHEQTGPGYRICTRCVMDTTDPRILFDKNGVCFHCYQYAAMEKNQPDPESALKMLNRIVQEAKENGKDRAYDCVIGLSGGVDSSYLAYLLVDRFGLRPLAVHMDNGWNSDLAVKNIGNIVRRLDIDLHTHVVDWEEFRDIQISYLKASVIDIEAITDHAINALMYRATADHDIACLLGGTNKITEYIMPIDWAFNKYDVVNLKSIHNKYGQIPLNTFPQMGPERLKYYKREKKIHRYDPLDYIDYNKAEAKSILQKELKWKDYGGKHYESVFTRFYQGYILPRKFNADKRKAHLSTLINSGQMTREEALEELKHPPCPEDMAREDYEYVAKKFGFSPDEFEEILSQPARSHFDFATDRTSKLQNKIYPMLLYPILMRIHKTLYTP